MNSDAYNFDISKNKQTTNNLTLTKAQTSIKWKQKPQKNHRVVETTTSITITVTTMNITLETSTTTIIITTVQIKKILKNTQMKQHHI